jgi:hypothetical protein
MVLCVTLVSAVIVQGLPSLSDISRKITKAESNEEEAGGANKLGLLASTKGIPHDSTGQASKEIEQPLGDPDAHTAKANASGSSGPTIPSESQGQVFQQAQENVVPIAAEQGDNEDEVGGEDADESSSPRDNSETPRQKDGIHPLSSDSMDAKKTSMQDSVRPSTTVSEQGNNESDQIDHAPSSHSESPDGKSRPSNNDDNGDVSHVSSDEENRSEEEQTSGVNAARTSESAFHEHEGQHNKPGPHLTAQPSESYQETYGSDVDDKQISDHPSDSHRDSESDDMDDTEIARRSLRDHQKHGAHVCEPIEQGRKSMRIGLLAAAMMKKDHTRMHKGKGPGMPQSRWEPNLRTTDSLETDKDALKKLYQEGQTDRRALDNLEGGTDTRAVDTHEGELLKRPSAQAMESKKIRGYGVELKIWTGWKDFWRVQIFR